MSNEPKREHMFGRIQIKREKFSSLLLGGQSNHTSQTSKDLINLDEI